MDPRISITVSDAAVHAQVELEGLEDREDLATAVRDACRHGAGELIVDLRCRQRPPVVLTEAAEIVRGVAGPSRPVRFVVANAAAAERVRAALSRDTPRASTWRARELEVELRTGDIVAVPASAVVNASNTMLKLGAGVSGALARVCGPGLQREMNARAPIEPGGIAVTGAHGLATTQRILHVATASGGEDVVRTALENVLRHCEDHALESVAVPALGTGTGRLPMHRAAEIYRDVIAAHAQRASYPRTVRVVLWSAPDYDAFESLLASDARFSRPE